MQRWPGGLDFGNFTSLHTGAPVGPAWGTVFLPAIAAEATVILLALCALFITTPREMMTRNLACLHVNSLMQSLFCIVFLALLVRRLNKEGGAWSLVFMPWYLSLFTQAVLHYNKNPDQRGRRPGFPVRVQHILALVVSFKLENAFDYGASSWGNVLWPLWGLAGFFGTTLLLAACCGLPMILRRGTEVRGHVGCLFAFGVLVCFCIFLPALVSAVRLSTWLDGDVSVTANMIMVPYIFALFCILIVLITSLGVVSFSSAIVRAHGLDIETLRNRARHGEYDDEADYGPALPIPMALVKESSTLFRRISVSTYEKYRLKHPEAPLPEAGAHIGDKPKEEAAEEEEEEEEGARRGGRRRWREQRYEHDQADIGAALATRRGSLPTGGARCFANGWVRAVGLLVSRGDGHLS